MEKKLKVFHAAGMFNYSNWFGPKTYVNSVEEADVVVFEGGTDVNPVYYGEKAHPQTDKPDIARDEKESTYFVKAVALGKKIVGVCRGSQLTCVLSGGRLVQHQAGQGYTHDMITYKGNTVLTTSTHHQAQFPHEMVEGEDYKLIAWTEGLSSHHLDGEGKEMNPPKEAEIVFYPKTNALAIQGHPEYMADDEKFISFYKNLLDDFLNDKL